MIKTQHFFTLELALQTLLSSSTGALGVHAAVGSLHGAGRPEALASTARVVAACVRWFVGSADMGIIIAAEAVLKGLMRLATTRAVERSARVSLGGNL
ncbi:hypothetical protein AcW1_008329 [Taiwanofungus camphoratus]|nr:hypothetical protein AcW1_008329 [Antrodia cinnamomea]